MIVITTPTGAIGHQLVEDLLAAGEPLRLIARDPSRVPAAVRGRVEVVTGSHGDPAVLDAALAGADALFWLVPPQNKAESLEAAYLDFTRPAVEAIGRHGVPHVVSVAALGRGTAWEDRAGLVTAALRMADLLGASGAAHRALALPSFMDNMLRQVGPLKEQGLFFTTLDGSQQHPTCSTGDIAAAAARLLLKRDWAGNADLAVLGPEDLSQDDQARIMGEVLGKPIRHQRIPLEALAARLREGGTSEAFVTGYLQMMEAKDHGLDDAVARTAETSSPTSFRRWCEEVLKPATA